MNRMWRPAEQEDAPLPPGDALTEIYRRGRQEWDERIGDAIAREHSWKLGFFGMLAVTALSVAGNVYQGTQSRIVPYVVERDRGGDVVAVRAADKATAPDNGHITAALKRWIRNVRTVYTDSRALKDNILGAYAMTGEASAAYTMLGEFYLGTDPFERARKQTVSIAGQTALPISEGDQEGRRTWRLEWTETVHARDGTLIQNETWTATVTFVITLPTTAEQVTANPDGLFVTNFSWAKR
jgi:type IV secretory pathway TrbF-like protein